MAQPARSDAPTQTGLETGAPPARQVRKSRGGRPTKQAAQALDRRILDVAARLFATQGFAATTIEQVATECRAGKDTIYRRYASKEALFEALIGRARREVMPELEKIASTPGDRLEVLRSFARAVLSINMRPDLIALNRVALGEAVAMGGIAQTATADDPIMIHFAALVRAAQADGSLADGVSLELAEQLLYATSIKPLLSSMLGRTEFAEEAAQDDYFDMAWNLFLRGAGRCGPVSS